MADGAIERWRGDFLQEKNGQEVLALCVKY
jgi:hypothetical protein